MAALELRLFIRATPERVWDVLSDLPGQIRWMEDLRSLEFTSDQQSGSGTVIKVTSELFRLPLVHEVMEITTWQPPNRLGVRHSGGFNGTGEVIIEPAPGGSVFTWREVFEPPLGPVGELGFKLIVGPHMRSVFKRSMENVRRLAEEAQSSMTKPSGSLT
ncbi:MAG TPA: SRPBCC family protein [Dehalococcoidia bacterium]|nr:SRPBCC family protein [Dehalococcoidia bacterium]